MKELEYGLYGLRIRSTLELSPLRPKPASGGPADVEIRTGAVPERLTGARLETPLYDIDRDLLLMRIPEVARYLVREGREIVVDPVEGGDPRSLELFLLGSVFGALCQQRGLLPLHASAVAVGDGCVAFTGPSGAGKSTMGVYLSERGYPLVCDDVCVIRVEEGGAVMVAPADARVKLWEDGLQSMNVGREGLRPVRAEMPKYHVPVNGIGREEAIRLLAVYVIEERGEARSIESLHGFDAMMAVANNTYRGEFIRPLGLAEAHFGRCGAVARGARIRRLTRPLDFGGIDRTVADLVADWQALELGSGAAQLVQSDGVAGRDPA